MKKETNTRASQNETMEFLLAQHRELKQLIDTMFKRAWDMNSIEQLMEVRSLNAGLISKFMDLITTPSKELHGKKIPVILPSSMERDYNLFEINNKLGILIKEYQLALTNSNLTSFVRMLIGFNYEKLVLVKDNLLHPIPHQITA